MLKTAILGSKSRFLTSFAIFVSSTFITNAQDAPFVGARPCYQGVCAPVAPVAPETSPTSRQVNWNPGIYLGIKPDQFFLERGNHLGGWRSAASVIGPMAICNSSGANIKGVRVKLEWGEYENTSGDYSAGDALFDDILQYIESRACGESSPGAGDGRTFQFILVADPKGSSNDRYLAVPGGEGGPHDNPRDLVCRQGNGGTTVVTCGARVYDPNSEIGDIYWAWARHVRDRYGDSPYLEAFGMRVEGAASVYNEDPIYGNGSTFQNYVRDLNVMLRNDGRTRAWTLVGTNNFRAGHNDQLVTIHMPSMDATGGQGVSHPDTFEDVPPGQSAHAVYYPVTNGSTNGGRAGRALHAHLAEFQRAGRTFDTIPGVLQQCCDPTYLNPSSDLGRYFGGPPSTTAYGATHATIITTFSAYPVSDFINELNSRPRGWTLYDESCPDNWLAAGITCVDDRGRVVP